MHNCKAEALAERAARKDEMLRYVEWAQQQMHKHGCRLSAVHNDTLTRKLKSMA